MVVDLIVMGSSADRSGADVNIPINSGENMVTAVGNYFQPVAGGAIKGAFVNSETAAMVEAWFKKRTEVNRMKLATTHLQTDPLRTQVINPCNYPIDPNDTIEAAGENGGAVLDVLGLYVDKGKGGHIPTPFPMVQPPKDSLLVRATGAKTLTADVLSDPAAITFDDFEPEREVQYKIIGMAMNGATALLSRLRYNVGPSINDAPGVPASDTSTGLEYMMFYGDFGTFIGANPPLHQTIGVAGDTAQVFNFLIHPLGGRKVA